MGIKKRGGEIMDIKQIEELLKNHEERIAKIESQLTSKDLRELPTKRKSIKEFILEKKPKGARQIGIVIAYYLEKYENKSSFTVSDLDQGFRDAKEPSPANMNDLTYKNTKSGIFMETKKTETGLKAWTLTNTGEKIVENNFENH
jgi:hypothetical protein